MSEQSGSTGTDVPAVTSTQKPRSAPLPAEPETAAKTAPVAEPEVVEPEEETVTVYTPRGYAFQPLDEDLPLINSAGVRVKPELVEGLVAESDGLVRVRDENKED